MKIQYLVIMGYSFSGFKTGGPTTLSTIKYLPSEVLFIYLMKDFPFVNMVRLIRLTTEVVVQTWPLIEFIEVIIVVIIDPMCKEVARLEAL